MNDRGNVSVVVGGQFGSEGKGAVAGWLARDDRGRGRVTAAVRVAGPNAGHSAADSEGRVWALRCIPVMAVTNPNCVLVLAAGSEIDLDVLQHEIEMLEEGGFAIRNRLLIDWQATILEPHHIEAEGGYGGALTQAVGSTGKGIGAARADRIWRKAQIAGDLNGSENPVLGGIDIVDTGDWLRRQLFDPATHVVIEGTQGFGLGLHAGFYPTCTSSDCRAIDFLAMAGISPWADCNKLDVWVTLRTFPIRVAGNSGPMHLETDWDTLSAETNGYIKPERTTVTQVTRRVGRWDPVLAAQAVEANGPSNVKIALTFFDYWFPDLAGATDEYDLQENHERRISDVERQVGGRVHYLGTGPGDGIGLRFT